MAKCLIHVARPDLLCSHVTELDVLRNRPPPLTFPSLNVDLNSCGPEPVANLPHDTNMPLRYRLVSISSAVDNTKPGDANENEAAPRSDAPFRGQALSGWCAMVKLAYLYKTGGSPVGAPDDPKALAQELGGRRPTESLWLGVSWPESWMSPTSLHWTPPCLPSALQRHTASLADVRSDSRHIINPAPPIWRRLGRIANSSTRWVVWPVRSCELPVSRHPKSYLADPAGWVFDKHQLSLVQNLQFFTRDGTSLIPIPDVGRPNTRLPGPRFPRRPHGANTIADHDEGQPLPHNLSITRPNTFSCLSSKLIGPSR
ncbi:hypothetical protein B0J13DRAFT_525469 [Dactylonectria estremocensis]|uniref:Uncharacterized protein n=1 Tax=Dactylonectria estremocensis TaxID=1079267 RepID=A0A9P9J7A9_9HYPO|nr:hypothetical protein B0J13DRAFT_525469 [Dactylonectria estremocensis]